MNASRFFIWTGIVLCTAACLVISLTIGPIIGNELLYHSQTAKRALFHKNDNGIEMAPIDTDFGIVIPKLGANARIIPDVDPYNSAEYQRALTRGVAHARGTVFPGQVGNIFLFSHSSVDFLTASKFNSVFYLLSKLDSGDKIYLYYHNEKYVYTVSRKDIVLPSAVSYLTDKTTEKQLTLMTCWPPGTNLKRLIISATISAK